MPSGIEPFELSIPDSALDDLRARLARTRWPERETVGDASQGAPLSRVQELYAYWQDSYDWRRCEAQLNALGRFRTEIDGLGIHFLHVRSPEPDALPLILTHDWPAEAGWSAERIAAAWAMLMRQLGYDRFVAQCGNWGSAVTSAMAALAPPELAAIQFNFVIAHPSQEDLAALTEREKQALADTQRFAQQGQGYAALQSTRPQTLGYGLTDSPAGQAAWIYE